jgi:hypothetical protein
MPNQRAANAAPLAARQDISVTNEIESRTGWKPITPASAPSFS